METYSVIKVPIIKFYHSSKKSVFTRGLGTGECGGCRDTGGCGVAGKWVK